MGFWLWRPDTCECTLAVEQYLDDKPGREGWYVIRRVIVACDVHRPYLATPQDLCDLVVLEQRIKNYTLGELYKMLGLEGDHSDLAAEIRQELENDYDWEWDAKRVLTAKFPTKLSAVDKEALQAHMDSVYGSGKVVIA